MIKVHEVELIFRLPQTNSNLPSQLAGLLTQWTSTYNGTIQSHPHQNHPPDFFRLSFLSNNFNIHVSLNQVHLHLNLNLANEQINTFLYNFYNQYQVVIKDLKKHIPHAQLRVISKIYFPFKEVYESNQDLVNVLHKGMLSFAPQGDVINFQLNTGYSAKNNIFKFRFQDYQMRQTHGQNLSMDEVLKYPVIENGIEVLLDFTHLPVVMALESEIVNIFRLLALNIESIPSNFFNNLTQEIITSGPTFN